MELAFSVNILLFSIQTEMAIWKKPMWLHPLCLSRDPIFKHNLFTISFLFQYFSVINPFISDMYYICVILSYVKRKFVFPYLGYHKRFWIFRTASEKHVFLNEKNLMFYSVILIIELKQLSLFGGGCQATVWMNAKRPSVVDIIFHSRS